MVVSGVETQIRYSKSAAKKIETYDRPTKQSLKIKIEGLAKEPPEGDIKKLKGSQTEYRLRDGKYRVIFEFGTETTSENDKVSVIKIVQINKIDSRGEIYK
jgi:mRNA interferase RelE/StbE